MAKEIRNCRLCSEPIGEGPKPRKKVGIAHLVLRDYNVDFKEDCKSWPTMCHNKCYMAVRNGKPLENGVATFPVLFTLKLLFILNKSTYYRLCWMTLLSQIFNLSPAAPETQ